MDDRAHPSLSLPRRSQAMTDFRDQGGHVAAVLPVHYHRALFRSCGFLPIEVWGPPGADTSVADPHLQAYTCSVVRSSLAFIRSGALDAVEVIAIPHACDSLQGLASLLLDLQPPARPVLPLYLPRGEDEASVQFLAAELRTMGEKLSAISGVTPGDSDLHAFIDAEERANGFLTKLLQARSSLCLSNAAFYALARTREYLPAERFSELCAKALADCAGPPPNGIPLVLSGVVPEPRAVLDALDDAEALVVADDLACCSRRLYPESAHDDPFVRMAHSMLSGPPCSMRGSSIAARAARLKELAQQTGARGVLFLTVKFCEPEQFYIPALRQHLRQANIATALVEVDVSSPLPSQVHTRLEALMETMA